MYKDSPKHVKMFKAGKLWVTMLLATGIAAGITFSPKLAPARITFAQDNDAAQIVTAKDSNGAYSVDPENTGKETVTITPQQVQQYFNSRSNGPKPITIDNNGSAQLTDGYDPNVDETHGYAGGTGYLLSNQQIDFTSDFSLNATLNIAYSLKMSDWLGGDGTSLFFAPLSANDIVESGLHNTGYYLGLPLTLLTDDPSYNPNDVLSFNVSSNMLGGPQPHSPHNTWLIYQAQADTTKAHGQVISTDKKVENKDDAVQFTFDMSYSKDTHTVTTKVRLGGAEGPVLETLTSPILGTAIGKGYTLGVSGTIADSKADYTATINSYTYSPLHSSLNITSSGLPTTSAKPDQSNIQAMAGNVIGFYPAGTTAPTTDNNNQKLTHAYSVKPIDGFGLTAPQFVTIGKDPATINLPYVRIPRVNVKYVDADGNKIAPDKTPLSGARGTAYSDMPITITGYSYRNLAEGSASNKGTFTADDQTITYLYNKDLTSAKDVTVNYQDQDGKQLAPSKRLSGNIGDQYTVKPVAISGYVPQKLANNSGPANGAFANAPQTVTFVYTKNPVSAANLTVHYQDQDGKVLAEDKSISGDLGSAYDEKPVTLPGYTYQGLSNNSVPTKGLLASGAQTITFVYKKDPVKAADLTVHYQDQDGKVLAEDKSISGDLGSAYDEKPVTLPGYTYQGLSNNSVPTEGLLASGAQTITFVYKKDPVKAADLTVHYQDQDGKVLAEDKSISGNVGNAYDEKPVTLPGYTYQGLSNNSVPTKGLLASGAQTITFVYKKDPVKAADLTVHYQDQDGKVLAEDKSISGDLGSAYDEKPLTLAGYTYQGLSNNSVPTKGLLASGAQTITFVYKKDPVKAANVTIHYQDQDGRALAEDKVISGDLDTAYAEKPLTFTDYTYQGLSNNSAPANGLLASGAQSVTFVYKKDPVAGANVIVHYQDQDGRILADSKTISGDLNTPYDEKPLTIAGYTYQGLSNDSAPTKGLLATGTQNATFIYKKDQVAGGSITVRYQDQDGRQLTADKTLAGSLGSSYDEKPLTLAGYTYQGLAAASAQAQGSFTSIPQTITFIYQKALPQSGGLTVNYVDTKGSPLKTSTAITGEVGKAYTVTPERTLPGGYTFSMIAPGSAPLSGSLSDQAQSITLVYNKADEDQSTGTGTGTGTTNPPDNGNTTGNPGQPDTGNTTGNPGQPDDSTSTTGLPDTNDSSTTGTETGNPGQPDDSTTSTPTGLPDTNSTPDGDSANASSTGSSKTPSLPSTGAAGSTAAKAASKPAAKSADQQSLPKTSEQKQQSLGLWGLIMLGAALLLGFGSRRREH